MGPIFLTVKSSEDDGEANLQMECWWCVVLLPIW